MKRSEHAVADPDELSRLVSDAGFRDASVVLEISKETWFEAEVHRTAGEIGLRASPPDAAPGGGGHRPLRQPTNGVELNAG